MSYQAFLEGSKQKFDTKKKGIFLGNLSMTQILDFNRFWGKKKSFKFLDLYWWFDSFIERERKKERDREREREREREGEREIDRVRKR